jgi:hypothetical protein
LNQVYVGAVPEFVPEAVNVTFPPEQTEVVFEVIATVGVKFPVTVKPIEFILKIQFKSLSRQFCNEFKNKESEEK